MESSSKVQNCVNEGCSRPMFTTNKKTWFGALPDKRKAHWRYDEVNMKYNDKPSDPQYFNKYMAIKVACPNCGKMVSHGNLSGHKKREICQKRAKKAESG
jgi:hypothetical protein